MFKIFFKSPLGPFRINKLIQRANYLHTGKGHTKITTLNNGLRVASENLGGETVSVGLYVDSGSRFEDFNTNGVAHFLEHVSFKGTKYRTQTDIELEFENMGGHLNAYTSREQTAFYSKVFKSDLPKAVEILGDIVLHSKLEQNAIERERDVIIREQEEIEKIPDEIIFDHLHAIAFPESSLGRTIIGPVSNIRKLKREDLISYISSNYHANRMVLSAAGAVDHAVLCKLAESTFSSLSPGPAITPLDKARFVGAEVRIRDDNSPLAYMVIAVQGASWTSPDYFPLLVAQSIIGSWNKGMSNFGNSASSRLAQIVSQNNLAQSFMSFNTSYTDTGLFGIYMVSDRLNDLDDLVYEVQQEWVRLCLHASDVEVERAKNQLKTAVLLSLDGNSFICEDIGRQILTYGKRFEWSEIHSLIDAIDTKTVRSVASEYLYDRCPAVVGMGAIGSMPDYNRIRAATLWLRN